MRAVPQAVSLALSHLGGSVGQPWEGPERPSLPPSPLSGPRLPSGRGAPPAWWGWASDGLMAPVVGLGAAGQGVIWDPPRAIASLSSSMGPQTSFPHTI